MGPPMGRPPDTGRSGGNEAEERASRFEDFLRSMDTNRDGRLERNEIPEERRRIFDFLAQRAGLDPNRPISISQVRDSIARRSSEQGGDSRRREDDKAEPLVPEFGIDQELAAVPEFGVRVDDGVTGTGSGSSRSSGGRSSGSSDSDRQRMEERIRGYAEYTMRRYDRNQNGVLDKDEWGEMRMDPSPADSNHDGKVTSEELIKWFVERTRERSGGSDSSGSGGSGGSGSSNGNGLKSYRFRTALERLEELDGQLPSWFKEKDVNTDGQVAMAEFSSDWTNSRVREFRSWDLNDDGLITPGECLNGGGVVEESATSGSASSGSAPSESPAVGTTAPGVGATQEAGGGAEKEWWE
jgi:Ca2+-binding EF-hand superfamily protein